MCPYLSFTGKLKQDNAPHHRCSLTRENPELNSYPVSPVRFLSPPTQMQHHKSKDSVPLLTYRCLALLKDGHSQTSMCLRYLPALWIGHARAREACGFLEWQLEISSKMLQMTVVSVCGQLKPSFSTWLYRATVGDAQMLAVRRCPNNFPCLFQGKGDGLEKYTSGHPLGLQGTCTCVFYQSIYLKHSSPPQTSAFVHSLFVW